MALFAGAQVLFQIDLRLVRQRAGPMFREKKFCLFAGHDARSFSNVK
jgi:hypothetical protein